MLRHKIVLCLIGVLLAVRPAYCQVDASLDQLRTVVPPSPNASSLGKFGEWPVSLFTGVPGIDIPIYELKGRSISVPVSIDYHAAGNRVGEIASWVGLGWALNAGGCISRTVQGLPDEDGYLATASNYVNRNTMCTNAINPTTLQDDILGAVQGQMDTQEDIYNLNVLGKSYRIYINAANDSGYTMPASNIRISSNFLQNTVVGTSTWSVVLEDGTQLFFGGVNPGNYLELTTNSGMTIGNFVSAWYLQSIKTVAGETINFTYTASTVVQPIHFTQSDNITYLTAGETSQGIITNSPATSTLGSVNTVTQLSLSTIESDLTRVYFIPSTAARRDLIGGIALSEIKVLSKLTGEYVEDWQFNYNYSHAASGNEWAGGGPTDTSYYHNRLKLASLSRNSTDGSSPQTWIFGYNPLSLPSQNSYAQDYWGFYNGATSNISLLPTIPFNGVDCSIWPGTYTGPFAFGLTLPSFTGTGFIPPNHEIGNRRSANETYMQAEVLNQITYPTGGYTVFNYEGNGQQLSQQVLGNANNALSLNLSQNSNPFAPTQTVQFTTTVPEYIQVAFSSFISSAIFNDFPDAQVTAQIKDVNNNVVWSNSSGSFNQWMNLYVPGTYTFILTTNCTADLFSGNTNIVTATATMSYIASQGTQNIKQFYGGLRVNDIEEFDGVSATPVNARYFTYNAPFVINPVDTINDFITIQNSNAFLSDGSNIVKTKVTRNTSSKYSLGSIQGGTVGYGSVTTSYGVNAANGYTISSFSTDPATQASTTSRVFPYPPSDQHSWRSGLLVAEKTYNASGMLLKSTDNTYNFVRPFQICNFKCGTLTSYSGSNITQSTILTGITTVCYPLTSEEVEKVSSTQNAYDIVTGDSLSTTTNYYYDDTLNMQPTRTVSFDSKGDSVMLYSRTPFELAAINGSIPLTASATTALDTMIARNIVSQPVETERYVNSILTYKALTNFKVQASGLVLPDNMMLQNGANPIETRVNFLEYDNFGNLLEQAKTNDINHNYIYDYTKNYPIAEIVNGDSVSIAYTSFEADGTGGWLIGTGSTDTTKGLTGSKSFIAGSGISKSGLNSANTYIVSYWTTNTAAYSVAGTVAGYPVTGKTVTINGVNWTYFEHKVTGQSTISVGGTGGNLDELRLYPATAQMTTYTYSPLIGIVSQCDVGNHIMYYEYDGLRRLKDIRDQDRNVLKTFEYHYKGQTN